LRTARFALRAAERSSLLSPGILRIIVGDLGCAD